MRNRKVLAMVMASLAGFSFVLTSYSGQDTEILCPETGNINSCVIVNHRWYSLCYNEKHEQAAWVSYCLTRSMCENNSVKRKNSFYPDTVIPGGTANANDYRASGYDRGHLCPAGDMNFSPEAMKESFYMSNISPQDPSFNRGIWRVLEEYVRKWALADTKIFIVTGGILNDSLTTIGVANKISVPERFYKVILDIEGPEKKIIGFIIPNKKVVGSVLSYAVPVDSIEKITDIDFFPQLNDSLENSLERELDTLKWKKSL